MLRIDTVNFDSFVLEQNTHVEIIDHMGGFDTQLKNKILDRIQQQNSPAKKLIVSTEIFPNMQIQKHYPDFEFCYDAPKFHRRLLNSLRNYTRHPDLTFENFLCSFNGSPHVARQLLVAILNRFDLFREGFCSKNFSYTSDNLSGHLHNLVGEQEKFYTKFFLNNSTQFETQIYSIDYKQKHYAKNIYSVESAITKSFLHLCSETLATSYYPNVTEKFLYSIVTRGLFLSFAQPGYHNYLQKYYGFVKYNNIFDYRFDSIINPVERLIELMSMIFKFSKLSSDDWRDLYQIELDSIEFNYNHYFSGDYLKISQCENIPN